MIVTKKRTYLEIAKKLKKTDKIGIIACNACARMCDTGGEKGIKEISNQLKKSGFSVVDKDLIGIACDYDQLKKDELKGDVNIVLACDSGVYNLKKIFPKKKIISGTITLGIGAYDHKGNIHLVRKF